MIKRILPLLLIAAAARAQTVPPAIPIDVEIGYRWFDELAGNRGMYRTQIDEQSGLLLRALTYATPDLRIDASNLGSGPAGSVRLDYRNAERFRLRLSYRTADVFSAEPSVAQHTFDRNRDMLDIDLELLPEGNVVPFIGYSVNR